MPASISSGNGNSIVVSTQHTVIFLIYYLKDISWRYFLSMNCCGGKRFIMQWHIAVLANLLNAQNFDQQLRKLLLFVIVKIPC